MKLHFISLFIASALISQISAQKLTNISNKAANEIVSVMMKQETCWNKMDFEGYMQGYWNSDSLQFIGKSGITFGWQKTLDNYKKHYPDKLSSRILKFTILHIEGLNAKTAFLIGKWHLSREKGNIEGYYTLLWKKVNSKWVIVVDHTN